MIVAKDNNDMKNINNIPELQSPFEQLREVDADGKEWWTSRKLARVMGYGKYWNFERVIAKAQAWTSQKGYHLGEHFMEITEMAEYQQAINQAYSYAFALPGEVKYVWVTSSIKNDYFEVDKTQDTRNQLPDIPQYGVKEVANYKYVYGAELLPNEEGEQRFFDLSNPLAELNN